jgi:hypothetical protein
MSNCPTAKVQNQENFPHPQFASASPLPFQAGVSWTGEINENINIRFPELVEPLELFT